MRLSKVQLRNDFEHASVPAPNGKSMIVLRSHCSDCGATEDATMPGNINTTCEQALAERMFRRKGWELGRRRKFDICPACASKPREQKQTTENVVSFETAKAQEKPMQEVMPIKAEPPREPSRTERRIVFAKLEDVYGDEKTGYRSGWTDDRVAKDLNVPRAWVTTIREENFGPAGISAVDAQAIQQAQALHKEAQDAVAEARRVVADFNAFRGRVVELNERLTKIDGQSAKVLEQLRELAKHLR